MKKFFLSSLLLIALLNQHELTAQVSIGADIMSRYIWRGVDYGNSPSLQPQLSFSAGGFSIGTWGAYSFAGSASSFSEHDVWVKYTHSISAGNFSVIVTDYYYPGDGLKFFNYNANNGAHVLEAGFSYSAPDIFPITISAFYNFHNEPDHSAYVETSYLIKADDVDLNLFAGFSTAKSLWYGTHNAALINVGLTASKSISITESFSLPLTASYILNPELELSYLVFGIKL